MNELERLNGFLVSMNKQLGQLAELSAEAVKRPQSTNRQQLLDSIFAEQDKLLKVSGQVCVRIKELLV